MVRPFPSWWRASGARDRRFPARRASSHPLSSGRGGGTVRSPSSAGAGPWWDTCVPPCSPPLRWLVRVWWDACVPHPESAPGCVGGTLGVPPAWWPSLLFWVAVEWGADAPLLPAAVARGRPLVCSPVAPRCACGALGAPPAGAFPSCVRGLCAPRGGGRPLARVGGAPPFGVAPPGGGQVGVWGWCGAPAPPPPAPGQFSCQGRRVVRSGGVGGC